MKKIFLLTFILTSIYNSHYSQESDNSGKPIADIFSNFHYSLDDDTTSGFGINRAFLGYNYLHGQNLSAIIVLNFCQPDDIPKDAEPKRYAFLREASVKYSYNKLDFVFGITTTKLYSTQQRFWGKRYISDPIELLHDYGYNTDLGISIDYKPSDKLNCDFSFTNGEGYSNLQLDNNFKATGGITIMPWKQMLFRLYGDIMVPGDMLHTTLIFIAGFKNELITIGAEILHQTNHELIKDHNLWGFSGTGSIAVFKNTELFIRYDHSSALKTPVDVAEWHYTDDDSFMINGIQYTMSNNLKMALNYQVTFPRDSRENKKELIYLSTRFTF